MSAPAPTWYDLLGVDRAAGDAEIRTAWKAAIADLDPGDRRFRTYTQAAEVLLDPDRRGEYDAGLGAVEPEPEPPHSAPADPGPSVAEHPAEHPTEHPTGHPAGHPVGPRPGTSRSAVPTWLLAGLALLTATAIAVTGWVWARGSAESVEESTRAAQAAAERAVVPILSYDHESLEQDQQRARGHLTDDYRKEYDKLFAVLAENAPRTQTTVEADVVSSGIVRSGEDRVQILVFVDRPTTNKLSREPVVYKDQVTLTMEKVDDEWLVDEMATTPPRQ